MNDTLKDLLCPLLDSVSGDYYQGKDWEVKQVAAIRALLSAPLAPASDARGDEWWRHECESLVGKAHRCEQWSNVTHIPQEAIAALLASRQGEAGFASPDWYRDEIKRLQRELDAANAQINQMREQITDALPKAPNKTAPEGGEWDETAGLLRRLRHGDMKDNVGNQWRFKLDRAEAIAEIEKFLLARAPRPEASGEADRYLAEAEESAARMEDYVSAQNLLHLVKQARALLARQPQEQVCSCETCLHHDDVQEDAP